jgi:PAS domain S-box-containing protein
LGLAAVIAEQSSQTIFLSLLGNGLGTAVSVTWALFILRYLGYTIPTSRQRLGVLAAAVSGLDLLFYMLSYETELVVKGFETENWNGLQIATFEPTLFGLPGLLLGFSLFIVGLAVVIRAVAIEEELHTAHGIVIFAATIIPVLVALLIVAGVFPNGLPVIPLAAVVSSSLYVMAFWRYDLFTLAPATERIGIEQAFDTLDAGIIVANDSGVILRVNDRGEEILEQDSSRLVGTPIESILTELGITRSSLPTTYKTNGRIYRISESQVTNDNDDVIGLSLLFADVTDRKERYRQRLSIALDAADAGVWEWDLQSDEIVWDRSMEQLVGIEPGSFGGSYEQFREQIHPADREGFDALFEETSTIDDEIQHECRLRTDDGERWIAIRAQPVQRNGASQLIGVSIDITDRKERERTFEKLYRGSRQILNENSTQGVCDQTIAVVQSVLNLSSVGVHLYDRETEALEPVAVSEEVRAALEDDPPRYTDRDTVIWEAYETNTTVRIDDTQTFEGTLPDRDTATRSAVVLSIGTHGVLITSAVEPDAFEDEEIEFLQLLSQLVEITLDRTVNEQGLTAIQQTVRDTLAAETHEEMASIVLEEIPDALDLPIAGIWKYQAAQQQLEPLGVTERATTLIDEVPTYSEGESIAWQTFESGSTTVVSDVSNHSEAYNSDTEIEGEITVPIGEFGVLTAGSKYKESFTELDAEILEILAANLEIVSQIIEQRQDIGLLDQVIARILRHNVRNKLTPIMGYANQIIEESDQATPYANEILENSQELEKISEHAREMRRIVQSRTQMREISLEEHILSIVDEVERNFPDGGLVVTIEDSPKVTAHPELATAFRHLIRNGFEHNTSDTPRVEVTVEDTSDGPRIEIADNGPGLDRNELAILEEHRESALEHGSGAGLWIVDRVLEYSEAMVEFETKNGTTVTITFPQQ